MKKKAPRHIRGRGRPKPKAYKRTSWSDEEDEEEEEEREHIEEEDEESNDLMHADPTAFDPTSCNESAFTCYKRTLMNHV